MLPTVSRPGFSAALSRPAALRSSVEVGDVLVMKVNDRSSKMVISAGTIAPRWLSVFSL